jgi:hypothetical protein
MCERKQVLLAHPYIAPPGGGAGVAAYVLQALQGKYDVSIACYRPPAYESVNRYFGTDLHAEHFTLYQVPKWLTWVLEHQPTPQALLRSGVLEAFIKRLAKRHHFDIYFSAMNEFSFPKRGRSICYSREADRSASRCSRTERARFRALRSSVS